MASDLEYIYAILRRKHNRAVLESLRDGPLRYSQLQHAVSQASPTAVHSKTLSQTLDYLRAEGLVERHEAEPAADYRLTPAGSEFIDLVAELDRWTQERRTDNDDDE